MILRLTCNGCGGTNLRDVRDEKDFIVRVVGKKHYIPKPLPLLCLDCGGTSHSMQRVD